MGIKDVFLLLRPAQLYIVLILSVCYFSLQMILSHMTHGLTLLMSSYHMLCNIFALTGCIITMKHNNGLTWDDSKKHPFTTRSISRRKDNEDKFVCLNLSNEENSLRNIEYREMKLRNTFGWARIDVLTMLVVCIFLASLSFSLLVEALQTLIHIDHQDSMHLPIPVFVLGLMGLILNGICFLFIGGYTTNQGGFLLVTSDGNVVLDNDTVNTRELSKRSDQILSAETNLEHSHKTRKGGKQSFFEMFRDVSSTIFVIVCAAFVYISKDEQTRKFIDPIISIFSCVVLVTLSFPYMKESCLILLQTIPNSIDIDIFERTLEVKFPEIISYHDLHIWQLTSNKFVATVHIKFKNEQLYTKTIDKVKHFFVEQGITIVTIQPEFENVILSGPLDCLVQCSASDCVKKVCCQQSRNYVSNLEKVNSDVDVRSSKDIAEETITISILKNVIQQTNSDERKEKL